MKQEPFTEIFITDSFVGFHRWPEAPKQVAFLRDPHRHVFQVIVYFEVKHDDRDLEFFIAKKALADVLVDLAREMSVFDKEKTVSYSCEHIARTIVGHLAYHLSNRVTQINVSEDGENGARLRFP